MSPAAARMMVAVGERVGELRWLEPPAVNGVITVSDVLGGKSSNEEWARDVWGAWATHHETIRGWVDL